MDFAYSFLANTRGLFLVNLLLLVICCFAAISDLLGGMIRNKLTYCGFTLGVILYWLLPGLSIGFFFSGALLALVPCMILYSLNSLGGGDLKLLTVSGGLIAYPDVLFFLVWVVFFGCLFALIDIILTKKTHQFLLGFKHLLLAVFYRTGDFPVPLTDRSIPFAVPIFFAACIMVFCQPYARFGF